MRRFPRVMLVMVVLTLSIGFVFADKVCPNCGAHNKDSDRFCKSCGAKLPEAKPPAPATPRLTGASAVNGPAVRITSDPPGASVSIDGHNRGKTPLELGDLEPGRHEYELTRSGYRAFYGEFTIAGSFGSIVVTTEPVGAEVLLDSAPRGIAPDGGLALVKVSYGRHTIIARLQGYDDAVKTVDLKSAGPLGVTCRLGYGKGWLVITSSPTGAGLTLNGRAAGKTPYVAELEPARYALGLERPGYYDWSGDAKVQFAESTKVRAILDRMQTRKVPLLIGAIAGLGVGAASAVMGQSEYQKYRAASTPEDAVKYRKSTAGWDIGRDAALLVGVGLSAAYWIVKW
jgi:hypothetical protein